MIRHRYCDFKDTISATLSLSIEDMLPVLSETVKIEEVIKPVYNYKAGEDN